MRRVVTIAEHYAGLGVNVDELQAQLQRALKCIQGQDADINKLHNEVAELRTIKRLGLLEELEQWRTGKRRLFWRVRQIEPGDVIDFCEKGAKRQARGVKEWRGEHFCMRRIKVKPKGAK